MTPKIMIMSTYVNYDYDKLYEAIELCTGILCRYMFSSFPSPTYNTGYVHFTPSIYLLVNWAENPNACRV